jgi:di/tripeptidase
VTRIASDLQFRAAVAAIDRDHDRLVREIVALTEIPAPPFKEEARARAFMSMLQAHGLRDVERDAEGNVLGVRPGANATPAGSANARMVAIVAHLDTVFPEGTDVKVRQEGTRLLAPGIGDNSRSLAVMLAMIRALDEAKIQTTHDLLFVGSVGEEGLGDLRGVKYLLRQGRYKDRIGQFIALDGAGSPGNIVNGAVGSKRYRVTFAGPGGHSYSAFGLVNPAFAMGDAMRQLAGVRVPATPKTTFNVGVIGGGTSVNTIPDKLWMEVDMRSESPAELEKLETAFLAIVRKAVDTENATRSTASGKLAAEVDLIGDRPSGQTPATAPLVQIARAAAEAAGFTPSLSFSSTDANLPISLGIPAIRLQTGGSGGRSHAPDEWIEVEKTGSVAGIRAVLLTIVAAGRE